MIDRCCHYCQLTCCIGNSVLENEIIVVLKGIMKNRSNYLILASDEMDEQINGAGSSEKCLEEQLLKKEWKVMVK